MDILDQIAEAIKQRNEAYQVLEQQYQAAKLETEHVAELLNAVNQDLIAANLRIAELEGQPNNDNVELFGWAEYYWFNNPNQDPRQAELTPYIITSSADSGPGTLRDAVSQSFRKITVAGPMTIKLKSSITTSSNMLIIDGGEGQLAIEDFAVKFEGTGIIIKGVNFLTARGSTNEDNLTFRCKVGGPIQAFRVENCFFCDPTDGGLDIIWNRGRNVYGTVVMNHFKAIDKACLIDSGEDSSEGGTYFITFIENLWEDCYQRMPMARNAMVHILRDHYIRYGKPDGAGGGAKSARGCKMLVVDAKATPRRIGEKTFDGSTVVQPRTEAIGPHLSNPTGAVKVVNGPAGLYNEKDRDLVIEPPYPSK